jgi:hypothetical protein
MADQRSARPVSGEIMTGTTSGPDRARGPKDDVVDADFEVVAHAPLKADPAENASPDSISASTSKIQPVPILLPASAPAAGAPSLGGMDMLRELEVVSLGIRSRGGPLFWGGGFALALAAFWVSGGDALVRHSPLLMDRGKAALSITGVTSRVDMAGENPVLFVDGEAANEGTKETALPPLAISVSGNDGSVTRYTLGTSGRPLAPGERFAFSSRLDLPRSGVKTVSVTFTK